MPWSALTVKDISEAKANSPRLWAPGGLVAMQLRGVFHLDSAGAMISRHREDKRNKGRLTRYALTSLMQQIPPYCIYHQGTNNKLKIWDD